MNLTDLQTGMIVITEHRDEYIVLLNTRFGDIGVCLNDNLFIYILRYDDNFERTDDAHGLDIIEILEPLTKSQMLTNEISSHHSIWKKPKSEVIDITITVNNKEITLSDETMLSIIEDYQS